MNPINNWGLSEHGNIVQHKGHLFINATKTYVHVDFELKGDDLKMFDDS